MVKKILLFIYFYITNFNEISLIPKNLSRIFSLTYWYTFIYTTNKRLNYKKYHDENWHKISKVQKFDYNVWKFVIFNKLKNRNSSYLLKKINKCKKKNISILEVGCGSGEVGAKLLLRIKKNKKINYTGLDFSKQDIINGKIGFKKLITNKKIKWKFENKNFLKFDVKNKKKYDFIFFTSVLEMIVDDKINLFIKKLCLKSKEGIFLNENYDKHAFAKIRNHKELKKIFLNFDFSLNFYEYKIEKIPRKKNHFEYMRLIAYFQKN